MQIKYPHHTFLIILICYSFLAVGQENTDIVYRHLDWDNEGKTINFKGAEKYLEKDIPYYFDNIPIQSKEVESVDIIPIKSENITFRNNSIKRSFDVDHHIVWQNKQPFLQIKFYPIINNGGATQILNDFKIRVNYGSERLQGNRTKTYASNSVLRNGTWYKLAITSNGIYKITGAELKTMGIDYSSTNPTTIKLYGGKGGKLPEANSGYTDDDLQECAIYVAGESDGNFSDDDYILFYAEGPDKWTLDSDINAFTHDLNPYARENYVFITAGGSTGKRISSQASSSLLANQTISTFNDYAFHENDWTNLQKSGRNWYGEPFENDTKQTFNFSFPNIATNVNVIMRTNFVARSTTSSPKYKGIVNGTEIFSASLPTTTVDYTDYYAKSTVWISSFSTSSSNIALDIEFEKADNSSLGWLDYIELNTTRNLSFSSGQIGFRSLSSVGSGNISQFNVSGASNANIWDVSDIYNVKTQNHSSGVFTLATDTLKEFVVFNGAYLTPTFKEAVNNQNLHAIAQKDYLIVTHPDFYNQAVALANLHADQEKLTTAVVTTEQVYNEFSYGKQDPSAIRNFVKMFYDRATSMDDQPKYLCLFGDASYDPLNRINGNSNFIVTYESPQSLDNKNTYASDDFFGFLDQDEGGNISSDTATTGLLDIGIGRLMAKSTEEANVLLNKIRDYYSDESYGDWRNEIVFVADDEDQNIHIRDADIIASSVDEEYPNYNIDKIYLDAYQQQNAPGGKRYPDVREAINAKMYTGAFIVNYTGHGGEVGWAHERILNISDINSWENRYKLPLFMTATCEFSRFDDPERTSAGELVLLKEHGGAIGLMTTTRLVYSSANMNLATNFYNHVLEPLDNGEMPHLGDIVKLTKNNASGGVNNRKFCLLGDPAVRLAYPSKSIRTTKINQKDLIHGNDTLFQNGDTIVYSNDTIKALAKINICGQVEDNGIVMDDFNGILSPNIFDKYQSINTLRNDDASKVKTFQLQKNTIYKGKVTVTNGQFCFDFITPKDIRYNYDYGKLSYYAEGNGIDASGAFDSIVVGGTSDDYKEDEDGPTIDIFLNDETFVFGSLTDQNPTLLVHLFDEHGINTVGNSFGHDITAIIDNNTQESINLNNFYEAELDNYKRGKISYPLSDLEDGKHTIKVTAWDVYNNASEEFTEFYVSNDAKLALNHVLNYPNPFTTSTTFFFEHNRPGEMLNAQVQIYTVGGRLIKTIQQDILTEGYLTRDIPWDGRDDFGDPIGNGVYIYVLKVQTEDGSSAQKYEKLVIIN